METEECGAARRWWQPGRAKEGKFLVGMALGLVFMGGVAAPFWKAEVPPVVKGAFPVGPSSALPAQPQENLPAQGANHSGGGAAGSEFVPGLRAESSAKGNSSASPLRMERLSAASAPAPRRPSMEAGRSAASSRAPAGKSDRLGVNEAETTLMLP